MIRPMIFTRDTNKLHALYDACCITIPAVILIIIILVGWFSSPSQQFSLLAQAFVHGHLYFLHPIGGLGQDPVVYHGHIYWGEGPFPALILVPFVWVFALFHQFFYQNYLQWLLVLGIVYFIFSIARELRYGTFDSLFLALVFATGSAFIGVAVIPSSWLFAQVVTTFLLFWSFQEFFTRKRWWLIGSICGCIVLTRLTAAPVIVFYALEYWRANKGKRLAGMHLAQLAAPVILAAILYGFYNFTRFHDPLNGGSEYQLIDSSAAQSRSLGVFSLIHVPSNLYSALLRAPQPVLRSGSSWTLKFPFIRNNPLGMSIFVTSPYLLFLFGQKPSIFSRQSRNLVVSILISAAFVLCYYGNGVEQYGYRYSLDFLPSIFVLLLIVYRQRHSVVSSGMRFLLLMSCLANYYLLATFVTIRL